MCRPTWSLGVKCFKEIQNENIEQASLDQIQNLSLNIDFEIASAQLFNYLKNRKIEIKELKIHAKLESLGELKEFSVYSSPTFLLSRDEDGYINLIDDNKKAVSLNVSKIEGDLSLWLRLSLKKFLNESDEIREDLHELSEEFIRELNLLI